MARALMCESPTDSGDPCDKCDSCTSILNTGTSMDFIEVDAATNSGKADVQKITEEIQYSTFAGRRRVYLFDEAHQLSKDALDALLKPLEENIPGTQEKRLVCIFCTTEPEKMKATIFSRCAPTFVVQPVEPSAIANRLAYICDNEGFEYDVNMLKVIAEITECHIRDAIKAIEGVSMAGPLNRENVSKYLRLDMNLLIVDAIDNIGRDLPLAMSCAKSAMLMSSPATCYEKMAYMAMLAYQVGIGSMKPPSYIERSKLESVFGTHGHNLIGFASKFSSRPGRPNESMMMCDLGVLHYGEFQNGTPVQPQRVQQVQQVQRLPTPAPPVQQSSYVPDSQPKPVVSTNGKKADVRVNPKAVNGYSHGVMGGDLPKDTRVPEVDNDTFSYLLALQISQYEGSSGPTGRSDVGRY